MNINKFKDIEEKYQELKLKLSTGEINSEELKKELKKMIILDQDGKYWMIGSKSGKWYVYNGTEWNESNPYEEDLFKTQPVIKDESEETEREIPDEFKEEKKEESDFVICKNCKSKITPHSIYCQICGLNQKETEKETGLREAGRESDLLIKSIKITSFVFFLGGLGLVIGVLLGATFGIFNIWDGFLKQFPVMLQETRGKIQGGLIFAALGGISGFIIFSLISLAAGYIYNAISYFFGGIRIKIKS